MDRLVSGSRSVMKGRKLSSLAGLWADALDAQSGKWTCFPVLYKAWQAAFTIMRMLLNVLSSEKEKTDTCIDPSSRDSAKVFGQIFLPQHWLGALPLADHVCLLSEFVSLPAYCEGGTGLS